MRRNFISFMPGVFATFDLLAGVLIYPAVNVLTDIT